MQGFDGQELLFWEDMNGLEHALPNLGESKCNHKSPTLLQDVGKITETAALPIKAIVYGQIVFEGEFAKATIGPLVCVEKAQKSHQEKVNEFQNKTNEAIEDLVQ